jgi:hypothetical protein
MFLDIGNARFTTLIENLNSNSGRYMVVFKVFGTLLMFVTYYLHGEGDGQYIGYV